jgi:hypothetical protein
MATVTLPFLRMDFNGYSLSNRCTLEDVERQGIQLRAGMRCVFYDLDAQDGENGLLHTAGTIWWDDNSKSFMLDMRTVEFHFTPGADVSTLRCMYAESAGR